MTVGGGDTRRRTRVPFAPAWTLFVAALTVACGPDDSGPTDVPGGVNTALVDSAYALARQQPNLTSLVVSHDGMVERQEYFHGGGADTPQDVRSVTKSVVALLVGLALERGHLRSLDQTVGELLGPDAPSNSANWC